MWDDDTREDLRTRENARNDKSMRENARNDERMREMTRERESIREMTKKRDFILWKRRESEGWRENARESEKRRVDVRVSEKRREKTRKPETSPNRTFFPEFVYNRFLFKSYFEFVDEDINLSNDNDFPPRNYHDPFIHIHFFCFSFFFKFLLHDCHGDLNKRNELTSRFQRSCDIFNFFFFLYPSYPHTVKPFGIFFYFHSKG